MGTMQAVEVARGGLKRSGKFDFGMKGVSE